MRFKIHVKDKNSEWWVEIDRTKVRGLKTAQTTAQRMIDRFNATLPPGKEPRELIEVVFLGKPRSS